MQQVGTVAQHGPMAAELTRIAPDVLDWQIGLLQSTGAAGDVPGVAPDTLVSGTAEGELCGGCLSLLTATLGTPYQLDARGKLLLLEDINEAPHRMERMLAQLAQAGILESAAGFVVGEATDADETDTLPMREIWADLLAPCQKPAVLGFPFGHVAPNYAPPLGVRARLNADTGT